MRPSKKLIDLLSELEGRSNYWYPDITGKLTIGIGHLLTEEELNTNFVVIDGIKVPYRPGGLTDGQVDILFIQDIERFVDAVNDNVKVELTQNQFDALVSFVFNVGISNFKTSTLLRNLNNGLYGRVVDQMRLWVHAGGKESKGLKNRREKEIALWLSKE